MNTSDTLKAILRDSVLMNVGAKAIDSSIVAGGNAELKVALEAMIAHLTSPLFESSYVQCKDGGACTDKDCLMTGKCQRF